MSRFYLLGIVALALCFVFAEGKSSSEEKDVTFWADSRLRYVQDSFRTTKLMADTVQGLLEMAVQPKGLVQTTTTQQTCVDQARRNSWDRGMTELTNHYNQLTNRITQTRDSTRGKKKLSKSELRATKDILGREVDLGIQRGQQMLLSMIQAMGPSYVNSMKSCYSSATIAQPYPIPPYQWAQIPQPQPQYQWGVQQPPVYYPLTASAQLGLQTNTKDITL